MKIGIDASRANRRHKTGTEWYSYGLIRELAKIDSKNEYILYSDVPLTGGLVDLTKDDSEVDSCSISLDIDWRGYQKIKSPHGNFKAKILKWPCKYFWTQGRLSLEMLYNRLDVLFVPSHALPVVHPKKSIVTIHDVGFEREELVYKRDEIVGAGWKKRIADVLMPIASFGKYSKADTLNYLRWATEFALKHAYKIITISNFSKKEILDIYSADEKKIRVVHNGYNSALYKQSQDLKNIEMVRAKYGLSEKYLLYIGRLEKKKNTPALIEAFAMMKELLPDDRHKLVLVGKASFGYDEVNYMIQEFDLNGKVIITGWVDEEDLPAFYSGATAFVFPSVYEGFGVPLIEAMACGVPIITSNVSSMPEVADGAAIFFNPKHVKSIADAMVRIVREEKLRQELSAHGLKRAQDFSWEKCAKETLAELVS